MITDEHFRQIRKQYNNLISHTLMKYHKLYESSELKQLANIALWKTLLKFDNNKSTFSGFLFKMIRWEILSKYRKDKIYITNKKISKIKSKNDFEIECIDLIDCLNENEKKLFKSKFVDKKTLKEISEETNKNIDTVFEHIKKIKNKINRDLTY